MLEVGGQPIEACSGDQSAEKKIRLLFQLSGWAVVALSCFVLMYQDQCCKVVGESLLFIFSDFFFRNRSGYRSYV